MFGPVGRQVGFPYDQEQSRAPWLENLFEAAHEHGVEDTGGPLCPNGSLGREVQRLGQFDTTVVTAVRQRSTVEMQGTLPGEFLLRRRACSASSRFSNPNMTRSVTALPFDRGC
jgi:hypothetical protein